MWTYELSLINKFSGRADALQVLKRLAAGIWNRKGIIRDIEYLGLVKLPYAMSAEVGRHKKGMYWLVKYNMPLTARTDFREELKREVDIVRCWMSVIPDEEAVLPKVECLLEEESLPPAYRKDVYDLMTKGKVPIKSHKL